MKRLFPSALLIAAVVLLLLVSGRAADKNTAERQGSASHAGKQKQIVNSSSVKNAGKTDLYVNYPGPVQDHRNSDSGVYSKSDRNKKSK